MLFHFRFPNGLRVWGLIIEPAREYDLKEAEFPEAPSGGYAVGNLETVRLYRALVFVNCITRSWESTGLYDAQSFEVGI